MANVFTATITMNDNTVRTWVDVRESMIVAFRNPKSDFGGILFDKYDNPIGEWSITPEAEAVGCACGMADFGTAGHDGDPTVPATIQDGEVWVVGDQEFVTIANALAQSELNGESVSAARRINGILYYTGDFDR